jgi:hypothetical protein
MALTLRHYPLASGVANLTYVNENYADILSWSGSLRSGDMAADAGIVPTQLSNNKLDTIVTLRYVVPPSTGPLAVLGWSAMAVSATTPLDIAPLPGLNGDEAWTVTDYSWVCSDTGSVAGQFDIRYGWFGAGSLWTNVGSIATGVVMTTGGDGLGNQGRNAARLSIAIAPNSTAPYSLALMCAATGTGVLTASTTAPAILVVNVRLRRVLQSV